MEAEVYQMARNVGSGLSGVSTNAEVTITALGKGLCDLDRHNRCGRCLDHQNDFTDGSVDRGAADHRMLSAAFGRVTTELKAK